jgi:hypothetical protein
MCSFVVFESSPGLVTTRVSSYRQTQTQVKAETNDRIEQAPHVDLG